MNEKNPDATKTSPKLSLAELLSRSMDEDELLLHAADDERERWDEDEGCFGG